MVVWWFTRMAYIRLTCAYEFKINIRPNYTLVDMSMHLHENSINIHTRETVRSPKVFLSEATWADDDETPKYVQINVFLNVDTNYFIDKTTKAWWWTKVVTPIYRNPWCYYNDLKLSTHLYIHFFSKYRINSYVLM